MYTYGYQRFEDVAGLFNCVFLLCLAFNFFCESFERLYNPEDIKSDNLILVSAISLIINIIGLIFFHDEANGDEGQNGSGEKNNVNL